MEITSKFSADIRETDNEYLVSAELPGVNKEDINLEYGNNNLIIKAIRQEIHDDSRENYIRKERSYGEVSRSFYLENVNKDGIRAKYDNGVLKVILPKIISKYNKNTNIKIE